MAVIGIAYWHLPSGYNLALAIYLDDILYEMLLPAIANEGPELFLGLTAAVGTDLDLVTNRLTDALHRVNYEPHNIHLARLLMELPDYASRLTFTPADQYIHTHMTEGDNLRQNSGRNDAFALLAVAEIQKLRQEKSLSSERPLERYAYIFRSLKHPDEVATLRRIYGQSFFLLAAYSPHDQRRDHLAQRIARSRNESSLTNYYADAEKLILRDQEELGIPHGQNLRDTYHRADVFLDTTDLDRLEHSIDRFVELIFGNSLHTPTRSEYAMFHAKASALRSAELGRQVGSAIARHNGDIVAVGTNEVPRAGGGLYWCDDRPDMREFVQGYDSNEAHKRNLIADTLSQLQKAGWLCADKAKADPKDLLRDALVGSPPPLTSQALIRNVIEFGRAVHAEMAAIVDAARRGVSIADCTMFVTTFPCHLCARHVVAAGITKVVYIEPYPKSLAAELYPDSIKLETACRTADQVLFEPFVGVAPRQYMQLFEAGKRKDKDGNAIQFAPGTAQPRYCASAREYLDNEDLMLKKSQNIISRQGLLFGSKDVDAGGSDGGRKDA